MDACCPSVVNGGHRLLQSLCELPDSCPSVFSLVSLRVVTISETCFWSWELKLSPMPFIDDFIASRSSCAIESTEEMAELAVESRVMLKMSARYVMRME